MRVVNFIAGPGAGKSTAAAGLFHKMKKEKHSVELVTEYCKQLVWEDRLHSLNDQLFILAQQNHRLKLLQGRVETVITDAPLLFSCIYRPISDTFNELVLETFSGYDNINVFLDRPSNYESVGRMESYQEALIIDDKIIQFLEGNDIDFYKFSSTDDYLIESVYDLII